MNQVILIGRLTRDPELKQTQNGKAYCMFSLAVSRKTKDAGVDFINCIVWNNQAENLAQYQQKGNRIAVSGSLQINDYTDKNGAKKQSTSVVCFSIEFLSERNRQQTLSQVYEQQPQYNPNSSANPAYQNNYPDQNINNIASNTANNRPTNPFKEEDLTANIGVNDDDLPF